MGSLKRKSTRHPLKINSVASMLIKTYFRTKQTLLDEIVVLLSKAPHCSRKEFRMIRCKSAQYAMTLLVMFATAQAINVQAHSGHKHDSNEPQISLPDIVARVNGMDIKKSAILEELKAAVEINNGPPLTADQEKASLKKLVDKEIKKNLISQKASELAIQVTPEHVEKELQSIKAKFDSDLIFEKKLAQKNMSVAQYKEKIKWDLMLGQIVQREMASQIEVAPEEIKAYYEKNPGLFNTEEKVRASVILIKVSPSAGEIEDRKAREKIGMVLSQIKNSSDFSDEARKHSQDSMGPRGGDLGFFNRKQVLPAFSERAFSLKVGEVSEIFKTNFGYHLLKVTEKQPETHSTLEEAKDKIREILKREKLSKQIEAYSEELKKKADIKLYF